MQKEGQSIKASEVRLWKIVRACGIANVGFGLFWPTTSVAWTSALIEALGTSTDQHAFEVISGGTASMLWQTAIVQIAIGICCLVCSSIALGHSRKSLVVVSVVIVALAGLLFCCIH